MDLILLEALVQKNSEWLFKALGESILIRAIKSSIIIQLISWVKSLTPHYDLLRYAIARTPSLGKDTAEKCNAYFRDMLNIWDNVIWLFSCNQAALWMVKYVRLSVYLCVWTLHLFTMFQSMYHHEIFMSYYQ